MTTRSKNTSNLVQAAREDLRFFSNPGRNHREQWVFEHWCALTRRNPGDYRKGESPDFDSAGEAVEITEVQRPGRKRGDEARKEVEALQLGNIPDPTDGGDLKSVIEHAHCWVASAIAKKAQKYGIKANDWILLVYVNYSFSDRTQWDRVRQFVATLSTFKAVHVLTADAANFHILKP